MVARSCPQTYYSKIKIPKFIIAHFDYQKSIWSHYSHTFIYFSSLSWIQQKSLHQWNLNNLRICFLFPLVAFLFLFFWYFRSLLQGFTRVHEKKTCKCPENCNGRPRFTCNGWPKFTCKDITSEFGPFITSESEPSITLFRTFSDFVFMHPNIFQYTNELKISTLSY